MVAGIVVDVDCDGAELGNFLGESGDGVVVLSVGCMLGESRRVGADLARLPFPVICFRHGGLEARCIVEGGGGKGRGPACAMGDGRSISCLSGAHARTPDTGGPVVPSARTSTRGDECNQYSCQVGKMDDSCQLCAASSHLRIS